ncbi:2-C-methyl-D-erythritol 2,4-cyclodiphosphate synthase [Anoxybacterium hadale]|uniref:2-C-methyl-D-erythritol 2,4-cyclodiphosphate synthase n=1 Tax=Anoxybacterium hadale TaxID=3408580 RepID=A0ACD1AG42_9FIRM|nr:2-C-methyl-D-erythritol 2,4-cyclodiphosphate synthase [Clostridiales bacterium]
MTKEVKTAVIIPAAGSGSRMGGGIPKQYGKLGGMSILARTVKAFADQNEIHDIIIVTNGDFIGRCRKELSALRLLGKVRAIIPGGKERQDSIYEAVRQLPDDVDIVLVHDGVRPFVTGELIRRTIEIAKEQGAAVAAVPVKDTVKTVENNYLTKTLDRKRLYSVQTPQGFRRELLVRAYEEAFRNNYYGTDDAFLVERIGEKSHIVRGDYYNIKITTMEDIVFGEAILGGRIETGTGQPEELLHREQYNTPIDEENGLMTNSSPVDDIRVGSGYDVHKLTEGRKLILGGVELPYEKGLLGHSDADVLLHAIMDAMLGAAALGDIGRHFPDNDEAYRGISSLLLLKEVNNLLKEKGFYVVNLDATVIAERPKIAPYVSLMTDKISNMLQIDGSRVNIKGTTTEGLGFCGRGEGIASQATVLIRRRG